ncbi:MAG: hypothetical protein ACKOWF_11075 [Chloroflexota bacterium]
MTEHLPPGPFEWHPRWAGQSHAAVLDALREEIAADQRAYALALAGADLHEQNALASAVALDRKWGGLAMDWADLDAGDLAAAMLAVEAERERRREMIPAAAAGIVVAMSPGAPEPDEFPEKSIRLTDANARLVALIVVLGIAAVFAWFVLR